MSSQPTQESSFPDSTQPGTYPVVLGSSLLKKGRSKRPAYASVQFNHKPAQTATKRSTVMKQTAGKGNEYTVRITDDDDQASTYTYQARRLPKSSYALVYDQAKQAFVLEKIGANINCNLTSTPWQSDPAAFQEQYPQLEMADVCDADDDAGLFDDSEEESSSEEDNPFDHRQWLDNELGSTESSPRGGAVPHTVSPIPRPANHVSSTAASPATQPVKLPPPKRQELPKSPYRDDADDESSQIVARPPTQLRDPPAPGRAEPAPKPRVRRAPQSTNPLKKPKRVLKKPSAQDDDLTIEFDPLPSAPTNGVSSSSQTAPAKGSPSVRSESPDADGEAEGSDDGLIIEIEPEARPKRGLGHGLGIIGSDAPMSLHAAASPLDARVTPSSPAQEDVEIEEEWEREFEQAAAEAEAEAEADADEPDQHADSDVDENLELPPPVLQRSDESDLEAELAQALASDPVEEEQPVAAGDVESESEEE